nr:hypothetical protein [uncultured archaeon]
MKNKFSRHWKSSRQPRKQRKYRANAPLHIKRKFLNVNLSKELRKKYKKRNLLLRKGDSVKIMRGKFRKKSGKVAEIDLKRQKIFIEGMQVKKQDGSKVNIPFRASNLQIAEINAEGRRKIGKENMKENKEKEKKENAS